MNNYDLETKQIENQPRLKIFNLNLVLTYNLYISTYRKITFHKIKVLEINVT